MSKKDITQKNYFDDNVRFADFMNAVCFHGRQVLKPEELESVPTAVLKADKQAVMERLCDVIKKQTRDGTVYAVYVMENQETVDYGMLVRIMTEESLLYDKQRKEIMKRNRNSLSDNELDSDAPQEETLLTNGEFLSGFRKTDRLTPVYTTVIYWGDKEWDAASSLRELIDFPEMDGELKEELLKKIPDYRIEVYDLNKETDFAAFQTNLKTVFEFYSHKNEKKELRDYMDTHKEEVEKLDDESKFFLSTMLGQKKLGNELLKQSTINKEERSMCKAIDDMIEDGREEGRAEGRAEAEAKAAQTIAGLKKELEEVREKSNCKAIDDMLADSYEEGRAEGRAESEATIATLRQELEQEKEKNKLEIDRLKEKLAVYE